ncbi:MAG: hypothetical protein JSW27_24380, partial [Phycisphaerales bacterium]
MKNVLSVLIASLLMAPPILAAQTKEMALNAMATTENGRQLATGQLRITTTDTTLKSSLPSTRGRSYEPVPMYMLISYLAAPTSELLRLPPTEGRTWTGTGDWHARTESRIEGSETVAGPAGTFADALKQKTVITGTRKGSEEGNRFVNGTRYLWFARNVGLVRLRYEHANGMVTEAALLSYEVTTETDSYLPVALGNRWTYAWRNDYRKEAALETWTMGDPSGDTRQPTGPRRKTSDEEPQTKGSDSDSVELNLANDTLVKIAADPDQGFHFPYYLFISRTVDPNGSSRLLVEMNNTGTGSDDLAVHDRKAKHLAERSYANRIARKLNVPLLVAVFPRPREQWQIYTHSLDEDTLLVKSGPLKRIDLQLIPMIRDAQALLRKNGIPVRDKVFMHGYSASGTFTNRFPLLHPRVVRAVAAGGVNGIPTFPATHWRDTELPYPVGIADLKEIADIDFDEIAYKQVAQYIYMGYLDRNDTTLSRDTYCEEHAQLIRTFIGADMGERWKVSQAIYRELGASAQCVTYNGTAHSIRDEMVDDVAKFFQANAEDGFVEIEPHQYPFVEFREIEVAHINGLHWAGDSRIPEFARDLFEGKGHFIITIDEWLDGQDHRQLSTFKEHAVFGFRLKANGHEDIRITAPTFQGTCSSGDGGFQGFVVRLPADELRKLVPGVEYTIEPINQDKKYYWV